MKPLPFALTLVALFVLLLAPHALAASGEASDFQGEWGCREENGDIYVQYTYFFYANGTGKFVHEGNAGAPWSVSELFTWAVHTNGTVRFGFSYGVSFYAYSFNADYDELTFTYEGGSERTYAKQNDGSVRNILFCGGILLPAGTVAVAVSVLTARRRQ